MGPFLVLERGRRVCDCDVTLSDSQLLGKRTTFVMGNRAHGSQAGKEQGTCAGGSRAPDSGPQKDGQTRLEGGESIDVVTLAGKIPADECICSSGPPFVSGHAEKDA